MLSLKENQMITRWMHRIGVPSDAAYLAALGSIGGSIVAWAWRNENNAANAERLGIFIGLWAPTFMLIGNALKTEEVAGREHGEEMSGVARRIEQSPAARKVDGVAEKVAEQGRGYQAR
jgi:hypothetical protein